MAGLTDILRLLASAQSGPPVPASYRYVIQAGGVPGYLPGSYDPSTGKWVSDLERQRRLEAAMMGAGQGATKLPDYQPVKSASAPAPPSRFPTDSERYRSLADQQRAEKERAEESRQRARSREDPDISTIPRPGLMLAMAALSALGNNPYRPDDNPFQSFMNGYGSAAQDRYRRAKAKVDKQNQQDNDEADKHDQTVADIQRQLEEILQQRRWDDDDQDPGKLELPWFVPQERFPLPKAAPLDVPNSQSVFLTKLDPQGEWRGTQTLKDATELSRQWGAVHVSKERVMKAAQRLKALGDSQTRAELAEAMGSYDAAQRGWQSKSTQALHGGLVGRLRLDQRQAEKELAAAKTPIEKAKRSARLKALTTQIQYLEMANRQALDRSSIEGLLKVS